MLYVPYHSGDWVVLHACQRLHGLIHHTAHAAAEAYTRLGFLHVQQADALALVGFHLFCGIIPRSKIFIAHDQLDLIVRHAVFPGFPPYRCHRHPLSDDDPFLLFPVFLLLVRKIDFVLVHQLHGQSGAQIYGHAFGGGPLIVTIQVVVTCDAGILDDFPLFAVHLALFPLGSRKAGQCIAHIPQGIIIGHAVVDDGSVVHGHGADLVFADRLNEVQHRQRFAAGLCTIPLISFVEVVGALYSLVHIQPKMLVLRLLIPLPDFRFYFGLFHFHHLTCNSPFPRTQC